MVFKTERKPPFWAVCTKCGHRGEYHGAVREKMTLTWWPHYECRHEPRGRMLPVGDPRQDRSPS